MDNKRVRKGIILSVLFIVGAFIIISSGYYKKSLSKETAAIKLSLNDKEVTPIIYDIANEGLPKRIVQPGKITMSTGHGDGIINDTERLVSVQVKSENFGQYIDISSKDPAFNKKSSTFTKPVSVGEGLNLNITFKIPRRDIKKSLIASGNIIFADADNGTLINTLPIKIINSNGK